MAQISRFGLSNFALRLLLAFMLVTATFNPYKSYWQWVTKNDWWNDSFYMAATAASGMFLIVCYAIFFRAARRSLGFFGSFLLLVLTGTILWLLYSAGLLNGSNMFLQWVAIIVLSLLLSIGMSWSYIRRRLSGQYDMTEVE